MLDFITRNTPLVTSVMIVILLIVIVGCALEAFRVWAAHKAAMAAALDAPAAEKATRLAAQTKRLEQRMRVLERIVTDRGLDVADEIEKLRLTAPLN